MSVAVVTAKFDVVGAVFVPRTRARMLLSSSVPTCGSAAAVSTAELPPAAAAPLTVAPPARRITLFEPSRLMVMPSSSRSLAATVCVPNRTCVPEWAM
ncbi:MAG: hypothetical protein OXU74_12600 [Gemmatimonadota bacterium]|nr:hypothetical protein [Gemmatimonadota bacterium]